ncbi:MAG: DUF2061 domain-containing protein [Thiogranum sp.]
MAFSAGYLLTGSVLVGGAIRLVEPAVETVVCHFHCRARTHPGKVQGRSTRRLARQS